MTTEYSMAGKLLELLKQVAPKVAQLAVLSEFRHPDGPCPVWHHPGHGTSLRVEVSPNQCA